MPSRKATRPGLILARMPKRSWRAVTLSVAILVLTVGCFNACDAFGVPSPFASMKPADVVGVWTVGDYAIEFAPDGAFGSATSLDKRPGTLDAYRRNGRIGLEVNVDPGAAAKG